MMTGRVDRIEFANFFWIAPVDGLMMCLRQNSEFRELDTVAELFTKRFGRELELNILGGFANGVRLKLESLHDFTEEEFRDCIQEIDGEILVDRPDIAVIACEIKINNKPKTMLYYFVMRYALLSTSIDLTAMSPDEADFYRSMFLTAHACRSSKAAPAPAPKKRDSKYIEQIKRLAADMEESAASLERRIVEAEEPFACEYDDAQVRISAMEKQKTDCERQLQNAKVELSKTFFLASGKKKEIQSRIDNLVQQSAQYDRQIGELDAKMKDAAQKKSAAASKVRQEHENLRSELEQLRIIAVLDGTDGLTLTEIMNSDPELSPVKISAQRVSQILTKMIATGRIVRSEKNYKAYFSLP